MLRLQQPGDSPYSMRRNPRNPSATQPSPSFLQNHINIWCLRLTRNRDDRNDQWAFAISSFSNNNWDIVHLEKQGRNLCKLNMVSVAVLSQEVERFRLVTLPAEQRPEILRLANEVSLDTWSADHPSHEHLRKIWDTMNDECWLLEEEYYFGLDTLVRLSREPENWLGLRRIDFE
ncbi:hypothetical protein VFPPC_13985 [Pochonia chlamydosporia 170]|uniref:Uncharacterized protein n=1 Tax=Pochonia chlamydosporia 170 TaxID=1380566 RepID=A0A179FHL8_METCM|nr:hypothetical protein VFPPC_13985 [Pochonia chlamydosporia 170]OAQ65034.1 hypothetical protein VFPPC_13985 [Pochonia chlamydosporia 170]